MRRLLPLLLLTACAPGVDPGTEGGTIPNCSTDADGRITAAELPVALGVAATYVRNDPADPWPGLPPAAEDADLDLREGPEDRGATFTVQDPADAWWAERFPSATHAAPSSVDLPDLLAVYQQTEHALSLLGLITASPEPPERTTEVHYDVPVDVLRFPLVPGATWAQTASWSNAVVSGVPNQGVEDWSVAVGELTSAVIPGGARLDEVLPVDVHLRQDLAISVGPSTRTSWQRSWYAGCFGELGSVRGASEDGPFDEYRRLLP